MVRKPKLVAFTPEIGRRVKKNAGGTLTSIVDFDTKPRRNSRQSSNFKIVQATGGIAARSGVTLGSATCTEFRITAGDLATNTSTITVRNLSLFAIPANAYVLAFQESISGEWIAQAVISGLRYQSPNLQYTIDGTTWVTWATANTTCPP